MDTPAVVWIGLSVYLLVMLGIGVASSRRNHDTTDYIVAGHQLSFGLCTFTLFATWFGIALLVGSAGAAYEGGFRNVISEPFGGALCLFLCGLFIFGVVRRLGFLTLSELFRVRYGRHAEGLASLCLLAVYLTWVTAMFAAFGDVLHGLSGLDRHWAIGIAALIVTAYTAFGGMWAVSLTDSVQAVILLAGLAYLFPVVLGEAGGWRAFATTLPASYFDFLPDRTLIDWLWHVQAWTVIGLGAIPDQALFQRASAARDARTARNSALLAAGLYLGAGIIAVLIGMVGKILLPSLGNPELVVTELSIRYLPPAGLALFVGALFSIFMSSADSALLAFASVFTVNLLAYLRPARSSRQELAATRATVVVCALAAATAALYLESVYEALLFTGSIGFVGLLAPMLAALFWKKANRTGCLAAMYAGFVSWALFELTLEAYPADLFAAAFSAVVLVLVTHVSAENDPPNPLLDADGEPLPTGA